MNKILGTNDKECLNCPKADNDVDFFGKLALLKWMNKVLGTSKTSK